MVEKLFDCTSRCIIRRNMLRGVTRPFPFCKDDAPVEICVVSLEEDCHLEVQKKEAHTMTKPHSDAEALTITYSVRTGHSMG